MITARIPLYLDDDSPEMYAQGIRDPVELWTKLRVLFARTGFSARYTVSYRNNSLRYHSATP